MGKVKESSYQINVLEELRISFFCFWNITEYARKLSPLHKHSKAVIYTFIDLCAMEINVMEYFKPRV